MTPTDTPGYYYFPNQFDSPPRPAEVVEGRIFLTEQQLICGAGAGFDDDSYMGRIDTYSGSTIRRLLWRSYDPQVATLESVLKREQTLTVPYHSIIDADLVEWNGSNLRGTDYTYGIRVELNGYPSALLLIQLGQGNRNRGSGRNRHAALANELNSVADQSVQSESAAESPTAQLGQEAAVDTNVGGPSDEDDSPVPPAANRTDASVESEVYCIECGALINETTEICPECGVRQPISGGRPSAGGSRAAQASRAGSATAGRSTSVESEVYCIECGALINETAEICPECGVRQPISGG